MRYGCGGELTNQVRFDQYFFQASQQEEKLTVLNEELVAVPFEQFMITLRKFINKDVPRVLEAKDWRKLDWHIEASCSMCDWLAYEPWLSEEHKRKVSCEHCHLKSKNTDHLSKIPFMTRGMRKSLEEGDVNRCHQLATIPVECTTFDNHAFLKRERQFLPTRASAFSQGLKVNLTRVNTAIPRYSHTNIYVVVNFDASTGVLASISTLAEWIEPVPYGVVNNDRRQRRWPDQAYIVAENSLEEEFYALKGFLLKLKDIFEYIYNGDNYSDPTQVDNCSAHIYFWERRQYEFLTQLIGRHLWRIIDDRAFLGLSWLFPPEELNRHPNLSDIPVVSFVRDCFKEMIAAPIPYAYTIINVTQCFLPEDQRKFYQVSDYFTDPFSDAIPKERIYEIWQKSERPFYKEVYDKFGKTMCTYVRGLKGITDELRRQLGRQLKRKAVPIKLLSPKSYNYLAPDAKLWMAYAKVCANVNIIESQQGYFLPPDELESAYKSIYVVEDLSNTHEAGELRSQWMLTTSDTVRILRISEDSKNSKIKEGASLLTIIPKRKPGFPQYKLASIFNGKVPEILTRDYNIRGNWKVKTALAVKVVKFDRIKGVIALEFSRQGVALLEELSKIGINLSESFSVVETDNDFFTEKLKNCLALIKNPAIAIPDQKGLRAQGITKSLKGGRSPLTPAAEFLWDAKVQSDILLRPDKDEIVSALNTVMACDSSMSPLEESQKTAILDAVSRRLAIIWGPPGTGKTTVAKYIIATELELLISEGRTTRMLITGQTYRACEVFISRLLPLLEAIGEQQQKIEVNLISSDSGGGIWAKMANTVTDYLNVELRIIAGGIDRRTGIGTIDLAKSLQSKKGNSIQIVVAPPQSVDKIRSSVESDKITGLFDYIAIDECSQVDVANAVLLLTTLAINGKVCIFGDHLQMPPIHSVPAPKGAEYMVGSYQSYLIERFGIEPSSLDVNFRSNPDIVNFGHHIGYKSNLRAAHDTKDILLIDADAHCAVNDFWSKVLIPERRVEAITYPDGKSAQANEFEAELVVNIVRAAWAKVAVAIDYGEGGERKRSNDKEFWTKKLGIVTPHKAQRALILRKLLVAFPHHTPKLIEDAIDTVERFQGGERDIIIIAFGVGDPAIIDMEEEFLLQLNRTNVAVSRAVCKSIMVISDDLVHHLPADLAVINTSKAIKYYVHQYCNKTEDFELELLDEKREVALHWHEEK